VTGAGTLSRLRVIDLSTEIAGPYCTKLLSDAGAQVIKVESPDGGDPLRRWKASQDELPEGSDGALFQYLNASKRSIALDVQDAGDRETLLQLAATADLWIDNPSSGSRYERGITWNALQEVNASLSFVSITPWGTTGPWADRPWTEFTMQAAIGSIDCRGLHDRDPVAAGGRLGEWIAGTYAAVGALIAWLAAQRSGEGQHVDLSIFEAMLLCLTVYHDLSSQWNEGPLPRSIEIPSIEPAKDGWVGFCTITGQQWKDFCFLIEHPEMAEDERFFMGRSRMDHRAFVQEVIHAWTRERTVDEIVEQASLLRIPVAPVGDGRTLPGMDHFVERRVFVQNPHGFIQPRPPYLLEAHTHSAPGKAPALDQHRSEILANLESESPDFIKPAAGNDIGRPLAGLRIVDLSAFWSGPIATSTLASLGADVVKVESIQRPDGMRFAGSVPGERLWEWSPVFHGANPGKRDVTLQLDHPEGQALLRRLIETADVVVENYSVRVLENFGLDWETLREWNPKLVMVRMPAFGLDGPWRDRTGFAMTIEQVSGMAWITGYDDLPLVVRGACDPLGGMHAIFALLLALEDRKRDGKGQLVEVPMVEVALNIAAEQVIEYSAYGQVLRRNGNRGPVAAPQGLYRCGRGEALIALAVATDEQWRALRTLMGDPAWADVAPYESAAGRRAHHDPIDAGIASWLGEVEASEAVQALHDAGIPSHTVINAHFLHPNPQLEHRGFFQTMTHPVTGETRYPGLPLRFSNLHGPAHRRPPPTLGQHNREILIDELGLSEQEFNRLLEAQVIGERPTFM